jgi:hypothetical protein
VTVDAVTDRETVAPGDSLDVKVIVWNGGTNPARVEGTDSGIMSSSPTHRGSSRMSSTGLSRGWLLKG